MSSSRVYTLLIILVVIWALNVVFAKIGLQYMPPIWLTAARVVIGAATAFIFLGLKGLIRWPQKGDWPFIISIGLFQIGLFQIFFNYGMLTVHAGRASILTYATPLWVMPLAILFFGEKLTSFKLVGFLLGISGIIILFSPGSFDWHDTQVLEGNGFLLLASLTWALVMLHTRYGKWHSEALYLLPWQLLISTIPPLLCAPIFESFHTIQWNWILIAIILFSGILATAIGYWLCIVVSKNLPVVTTSLALLNVPVLTLLFSAWFLHEPLTANNLLAMVLIIAGLSCIAAESHFKKKSLAQEKSLAS